MDQNIVFIDYENMIYLLLKVLITATLIVFITEIAKINDKLGGLISAMPITTLFIVSWLYYDNVSNLKIANHISYTFLYVVPTLPMFLIFPYLIEKFGFYIAIFCSIIITVFCVILMNYILKKFGINF